MLPTVRVMSHCAQVCHISLVQDGDSGLVVAEQLEELVCELWGPQLDGQSGIESHKVIDGRVGQEYT